MTDHHDEIAKAEKVRKAAEKMLRKAQGGRGPFERGPFGGGPFGPGPFGEGARRRGRRGFGESERGSVKYDILGILWDGPRHGYDIMLTIEEQRGHRPSPGSIYPALQMLEEGDFLTGKEIDGKRVYTITDKGSELLAKHRETTDDTQTSEETNYIALMHRGVHTMMGLKSVLKEIARTRDPKLYAAALKIIETARRELYELMTAE